MFGWQDLFSIYPTVLGLENEKLQMIDKTVRPIIKVFYPEPTVQSVYIPPSSL